MNSNRWIIGVIVVLSMALLIGRHFDARFAGGDGYRPRSVITIVSQTAPSTDLGCESVDVSRQNVLSCSSMMKVAFGSSTIWMDDGTSLVVINDREGKEELALYGGRIVVKGSVIIDVRDLHFTTAGTMTLVNYGWLYRVDVLAMESTVSVVNPPPAKGESEGVEECEAGSSMSFNTLPPYENPKPIEFNTESESVKAFYKWAR